MLKHEYSDPGVSSQTCFSGYGHELWDEAPISWNFSSPRWLLSGQNPKAIFRWTYPKIASVSECMHTSWKGRAPLCLFNSILREWGQVFPVGSVIESSHRPSIRRAKHHCWVSHEWPKHRITGSKAIAIASGSCIKRRWWECLSWVRMYQEKPGVTYFQRK